MLPGDVTGPATGHGRFRVVSRTTLVDAEGRRHLGLHHWPDGTIGRFVRDGRIVTVGPNGDGLARTEFTLPRWSDRLTKRFAGVQLSLRARPHGPAAAGSSATQPSGPEVLGLGTLTEAHGRISHMKEPADYMAGGPVFYDADRDLALLVYHAEEHAGGDPRDFFSSLGLAASRDGGSTWTDLGRIVRAQLPASAASRTWGPVEMGPGALLWTDDRLVVLFGDFRDDGRRVNLAAASAPRRELLDAAAQGRCVEWRKWDGRSFAEPGLGGRSAELLSAFATYGQVAWTDAAWLHHRQRWALVAATNFMGAWVLVVITTTDGVRWSAATVVEGSRCEAEALYVSAHEPLTPAEASELGPDGFAVLRVVSSRGGYDRWDDAFVERLVVAPST